MSFVSQRSLFLFLLPPFPTTIKTTFSPYKTTFRFLPTPTTMQNFFIIFSLLLFLGVTIVEAQQEGKAVVQQQQLWCVAKNNAEDTALQQALDWACGPGGANCGPIQNSGPCYDPNDLIDMATYAFNDYCLKHGMSDETCNFSNTAALTALDPSHDKCKYTSSKSNRTGPKWRVDVECRWRKMKVNSHGGRRAR
ncbi:PLASMODESMATA CALLOSE-BINDING PROTEIN 5 isoform X2 [Spinacia oleracea]|uniref:PLASMODESMATA CALLOSE-BINDING PROTEIN 5 isoform X2 n=1 Tax=Spinacia oleracea TaxID=3562 RepID=A0A9R0JSU3_SPIOL|nr:PLASMODESMATA CALLOSE-BINDING PROTEIN 5 isoform X2 [Spinacia oleracea]